VHAAHGAHIPNGQRNPHAHEEAQSWGKIAKDASMMTCHSDSTIAMPILVSALLEHHDLVAKRHRPSFQQGLELGVTA